MLGRTPQLTRRRSSVSSSGAAVGLAEGHASASFAQASGDDGFQRVLTVRAVWLCCAKVSELSFDHGEILVVVRKHDSWWDACSKRRAIGVGAANHVEQVDAQCIVMDEAARAIVQAVKTMGQQQAPQTALKKPCVDLHVEGRREHRNGSLVLCEAEHVGVHQRSCRGRGCCGRGQGWGRRR